jgi:uncharacterized protein (DUF2235 family)
MEAYKFLSNEYKDGDKIYLFGTQGLLFVVLFGLTVLFLQVTLEERTRPGY